MRYEEAETATKSSEDARVEKGTASGQAWEMRCRALLSQALVHAVEAARVSSRPALARDSVVLADEGCRQRTQTRRSKLKRSSARLMMVLQPEDNVSVSDADADDQRAGG